MEKDEHKKRERERQIDNRRGMREEKKKKKLNKFEYSYAAALASDCSQRCHVLDARLRAASHDWRTADRQRLATGRSVEDGEEFTLAAASSSASSTGVAPVDQDSIAGPDSDLWLTLVMSFCFLYSFCL